MKIKIITAIGLFIVQSGYSVAQGPDSFKQDHFHGKIKSCKELSYEAINNSGEISKGNRKIEDNGSDYNYIFDEKGNIIETQRYNSNDVKTGNEIYRYNNIGKMTEEYDYNNDSSIFTRYVYQYDSVLNYFKPKSTANIWTKKTTKMIYSSGVIMGSCGIYYDTRGNSKEEYKWDKLSNGPDRRLYIAYEYNVEGNLIKSQLYDISMTFNADPNIVTTYQYDKKGNVIEENLNNSITKYTYEYDGNNNWIKKTVIMNDAPKFIIERTIEYY